MSIIETGLTGRANKETDLEKYKSFLLFVRGIPGSGKSFLSKALKEELSTSATSISILDPDTIKDERDSYQQFTENLSKSEPDLSNVFYTYRYLLFKAKDALTKEGIIIWNQPFRELKMLEITINKLKNFALGQKIKVLIIEINIPLEIAIERVRIRKESGGHGPEEKKIADYNREYISSVGLGYDIVTVDGKCQVGQSVSLIIEKMTQTRNER